MNSREAFEMMHNYFRIPDPTVRKRLFQLVRVLAYAEARDGAEIASIASPAEDAEA